MFRDKRVRSGAIFWPIAMIVMFLYLFGFLASTLSKPENLKVHVVKGESALAEAFKKANQRTFPTWTDVLEIVRLLGYRKTMPMELTLRSAEDWREAPDTASNVRPERWHERAA